MGLEHIFWKELNQSRAWLAEDRVDQARAMLSHDDLCIGKERDLRSERQFSGSNNVKSGLDETGFELGIVEKRP